LTGCGANSTVLRSGKETPTESNAAGAVSSFATDLESMRTAKFSVILVLRRRDGGPIDGEDRGVIRLQTTDVNRRVASDDDRAFLIGSNFQLLPANMKALYDRFVVEDYSPPAVANTNASANVNK